MKKIIAIILSIFILLGICYPCNILAATLPTVGISSLSVKENNRVTVKWKKKSKITGYQIQYSPTVSLKRTRNQLSSRKQKQLLKKFQI